jgi:hypothetical protein
LRDRETSSGIRSRRGRETKLNFQKSDKEKRKFIILTNAITAANQRMNFKG